MTFTDAARDALKGALKTVAFRLRLKTRFPESNTFAEFALAAEDFSLTRDAASDAAALQASLIFADPQMADEYAHGNRVQLFAEVELWCDVVTLAGGVESERLFHGVVTDVRPQDFGIDIAARDMMEKLARSTCRIDREASFTADLGEQPIYQAPEGDALTYGLDPTRTPDGFSSEGVRRAWREGDIRVFADGAEVPAVKYYIYADSGLVRFASAQPGVLTVTGVKCYIEGTNDLSLIIADALTQSWESGGPGVLPGDLDFPFVGVDLNRIRWEVGDGTVAELWKSIRRAIPQNVRLWYESDAGTFELRAVAQAETPPRALFCPVSVATPRSTERIATRVVLAGEKEAPALLSAGATLTDLQTGQGEAFRWDGNAKTFGAGTIDLARDGNPNCGFGRHAVPYVYQFYDFALFDLGLEADGRPPVVGSVVVTAANSLNANSQSLANPNLLFGYEAWGSNDGVAFDFAAPGARIFLRALETGEMKIERRYRYVKIRVKPAQDDADNGDDPALAANEIRVFGAPKYAVEAKAQGDDPMAPHYYPHLVTKASRLGHVTHYDDMGRILSEFAAEKLAHALLDEYVRLFQQVEFESVCDPTVRLYDTARVVDQVTGRTHDMLVERVTLDGTRTVVAGTNWRAPVFG